jgi:membrane protease YdiL (CAAX protease family)
MTELPPVPPEHVPPAPGLPSPDHTPPGSGAPDRPDLDRPLATWRWWEVVIAYVLGAYVLGALVSLPIFVVMGTDDGVALILGSIVIDLVLAAVLVLWLDRSHPTWRRVLGFPGRGARSKEIAFGAVSSLVILFVAGVAGAATQGLLTEISGREIVQPEQLPDDLGLAGTILSVVFVCIVAPIVEEFVFRGLLFRSIRDRYGAVLGVILSGVAFGLIHIGIDADLEQNLLLQVPLALVGMGFAIVYEMRGNLLAPIAAHVTFNVIGLVVILTGV